MDWAVFVLVVGSVAGVMFLAGVEPVKISSPFLSFWIIRSIAPGFFLTISRACCFISRCAWICPGLEPEIG